MSTEAKRAANRRYMQKWRQTHRIVAQIRDRKQQARKYSERNAILQACKAVSCADCDCQYPSYVMDFDHVRGEKKFSIGLRAWQVSITALIAEIEKCDVVCANCHRERTHRRKLAQRSKSVEQHSLAVTDVPSPTVHSDVP